MVEPFVVPVGDIEGAVGPGQTIDGPEPGVVAGEECAALLAAKRRATRGQGVPVELVGQGVGRDVSVAELLRQTVSLIDDAAAGDVAALESFVRDVLEISEGIGIVQLAMFGETFDKIGALHLVQGDDIAVVCAGDGVAVRVEVESPGVAAPLREQFERARSG